MGLEMEKSVAIVADDEFVKFIKNMPKKSIRPMNAPKIICHNHMQPFRACNITSMFKLMLALCPLIVRTFLIKVGGPFLKTLSENFKIVKMMFGSGFFITLIKCLKGHRSLRSL